MLRYGDSLTSYLHAVLHDRQDAEDLMIETFARIMVKKPGISEGAFKAYLFKTGRNLALRLLHKKKRQETFSLEDLSTDPAADELVEERLLLGDQRELLHLCLERIDPILREVLWLIYFEGMSYAQAAEVMKTNTKRIDHLLTRAKKHLRGELSKEGFDYAYE